MSERSLINRVENPRSLFNSILSSAARTPAGIAAEGIAAAERGSAASRAAAKRAPVPRIPTAIAEQAPAPSILKNEDPPFVTDDLLDELAKSTVIQDNINNDDDNDDKESEINNLQRYNDDGTPVFTEAQLIEQISLDFLVQLRLKQGYLESTIDNSRNKEQNEQFDDEDTIERLLNIESTDYSQIPLESDMRKILSDTQVLQEELRNRSIINNIYAANNQKIPAIAKPTRADGSCFYSSIYRAAQEQGLLNAIRSIQGIIITDETTFINTFRIIVGNKVTQDGLPFTMNGDQRIDTFDYLENIIDEEDYVAIITHFPQWFQNEFPTKSAIGTKQEFIQKFIRNIIQPTSWVSSIEIELVKTLLSTLNIRLTIVNSPIGGPIKYTNMLTKTDEHGNNVINLLNLNEQHYEYFSFNILKIEYDRLEGLTSKKNNILNGEKYVNFVGELTSHKGGINLKRTQIKNLTDMKNFWETVSRLFLHISSVDKYWNTAWQGNIDNDYAPLFNEFNKLEIKNEAIQEKLPILHGTVQKIGGVGIGVAALYEIVREIAKSEALIQFATDLNSPVGKIVYLGSTATILGILAISKIVKPEKAVPPKPAKIPVENITIDAFKDILYYIFLLDKPPKEQSIQNFEYSEILTEDFLSEEKSNVLGAQRKQELLDTLYSIAGAPSARSTAFAPLATSAPDIPIKNPNKLLVGGDGTLSLLAKPAFVLLGLSATYVLSLKRDFFLKKANEEKLSAEKNLGKGNLIIKEPVSKILTIPQYDRFIRMIDTKKQCLDPKYRNIIKDEIILVENYIKGINSLINLYEKEIEISKNIIKQKIIEERFKVNPKLSQKLESVTAELKQSKSNYDTAYNEYTIVIEETQKKSNQVWYNSMTPVLWATPKLKSISAATGTAWKGITGMFGFKGGKLTRKKRTVHGKITKYRKNKQSI